MVQPQARMQDYLLETTAPPRGQTVVVDNKPGAGLGLGADFVAQSPADGYTLLMGAVHHSIAQAVYVKRCSVTWRPSP